MSSAWVEAEGPPVDQRKVCTLAKPESADPVTPEAMVASAASVGRVAKDIHVVVAVEHGSVVWNGVVGSAVWHGAVWVGGGTLSLKHNDTLHAVQSWGDGG